LTGTAKFTSSCDIAKAKLVAASVHYTNESAPAGAVATVRVGNRTITAFDAEGLAPAALDARMKAFTNELSAAIEAAGYPAKADPAQIDKFMIVVLIFIVLFFVAMGFGPVAAVLVELFPTRIRYSSLSLPYHIGTGWFGGLAPTIAFALVALTGDIYSGLWFPISVGLATVVIGVLFIPETRDVDVTK
jgi:hypothetical protein